MICSYKSLTSRTWKGRLDQLKLGMRGTLLSVIGMDDYYTIHQMVDHKIEVTPEGPSYSRVFCPAKINISPQGFRISRDFPDSLLTIRLG